MTYLTASDPDAVGEKHSYRYYVELASARRDYECVPEFTLKIDVVVTEPTTEAILQLVAACSWLKGYKESRQSVQQALLLKSLNTTRKILNTGAESADRVLCPSRRAWLVHNVGELCRGNGSPIAQVQAMSWEAFAALGDEP